jgi:hypothetical protein
VDFGSGGTGMNVAAKLRQQQCDEQAKTKGAKARADRLATAEAEALAKARTAWSKLEPELKMCAKLKRSERDGCIAAANNWLGVARAMQVTIPAGIEPVQTDCGERHPAYPADIQTVSGRDVKEAEALLDNLKRDFALIMGEAESHYEKREYKKAATLFQQACEGGEQLGCAFFSNILFGGKGTVPKDTTRASRLMKAALPHLREQCDDREWTACRFMGLAYADGIGVSKDGKKSASLYKRACDGGSLQSCHNYGYNYLMGEGVTQDSKLAILTLQKACQERFAPSCGLLGMCYRHGQGVPKNESTARRYFRKSCDLGEKAACDKLR